MITKQQLEKMKGWFYSFICTNDEMEMSGWKLYIYGENIDDSYNVCSLVTPIAKKYDLTMKVASQRIINRNNMRTDVAWSIAVIYLDPKIFRNNQISSLINDITSSLTDYTKSGNVTGAKSLNGKVHYRYDLKEPVNPEIGVPYDKYTTLYRGETGEFNIPNNYDVFETVNV